MRVKQLEDGRLVVPHRAESDGVVGMGFKTIGPDDPEYKGWVAYLKRTVPAPEADPAALALAIITARSEGDEGAVKKLEAMLPAEEAKQE